METLVKSVNTRQREPGTPLPRYLYSRSVAGSTHRDLARGIAASTNGTVVTKFFAFYPERKISLSHWLHYWISRGKQLRKNIQGISVSIACYVNISILYHRCCTYSNVKFATLWRGV